MKFKAACLAVLASCVGASFAGAVDLSEGVIVPGASAVLTRQTIQAAIDAAANLPSPGTVALGEGTFEIDAQLMVTGGVTLVGQGWETTVIKQTTTGVGENAGNGRCATVSGGSRLMAVTLTGGHIRKNWTSGAGVLLDGGTVSRCRITGNQVGDAQYQSVNVNNIYGAGISIIEGSLDHSVITGNIAYMNGGGASHGGGIGVYQPTGPVLIDSCLVYGNRAPGGNGGGIVSTIYNNSLLTIRNTTIVGNIASSKGGGIHVEDKKPVLVNVIAAQNEDASGLDISGEMSSSSSNNLIGEDPVFIDAQNNDFRLSKDSPAIGAGMTYEGIGDDLDGNAFYDPPSIGCYEIGNVTENPQFAVVSGSTFFPSMKVEISCANEGASIYYTTDGSSPSDSSALYTGPFEINETVTVKARAYAAGIDAGGVVSATYTRKRPVPRLKDFKKCIEITLKENLHAENEITTGIPALVRLSESTVKGFFYSDFSLVNGEDMMFADETGNILPHEVDTWDATGESLVWVKLPSTSKDAKIAMYYGNGAISSQEPVDVWTDYVGVWHFSAASDPVEQHSQGTYANSTAVGGIDGHVAKYAKMDEIGLFGKCFRVNDSTGKAAGNYSYGGVWVNDSGDNSPIDGGEHFTVSGWFKHGDFDYSWDHIFYKRKKSNNSDTPQNAFAIECNASGGISPNPMARGSSAIGPAATSLANNLVGKWGYLTFVYDGGTCYIYADGVLAAKGNVEACKDNDSPLVFGNNCDIASGSIGDSAWNGHIDEVRYSKGAKSADWVAAEFKAMNAGEEDVFVYGKAGRMNFTGMKVIVR